MFQKHNNKKIETLKKHEENVMSIISDKICSIN